MKYKDIAEKYGVSLATVKSWKTRYGWFRDTSKKSTHTRKRGGQPGNHNALYNAGGAPKQNQNAVKHGLLAKYLPKETLDIVMEVEESSPIDILYMNIKVQFARIIRAQKLMYVEGIEDHTRVTENRTEVTIDPAKRTSRSVTKTDKVISSVDKEVVFMKAQSVAMATLTKMIQEYDDLCRGELATEEQKARIAKLKNEVAVIKQQNEDNKTLVPIIIGGDEIED